MIARFLLFMIRAYQRLISPLIGPVCRFEPSCSRYTATCIERHGARRGTWLGIRRLARCHPFHPGGVDLPPERVEFMHAAASAAPHSLPGSPAAARGESRTSEPRPS